MVPACKEDTELRDTRSENVFPAEEARFMHVCFACMIVLGISSQVKVL